MSARFTPSKAAQADVVYLFPDLSKAGDAQYHRNLARGGDSVLRRVLCRRDARSRNSLHLLGRKRHGSADLIDMTGLE
jgi:hypothetical protein